MLLLRLILLFLICYVLITVLRSLIGRGKGDVSSRIKSNPDGEEMVLDPQCHSYVPKSDAVVQSGRYFCSQECARLYLTR
ncbi:MAG: PP0621 family protein [Candidatus Binatia bacterium]